MFASRPSVLTSAAVAASALVLLATATPALAQGSASDLRAQYVADLETLESKFNDLAGAMDADMYGWRPMEGVRSVSEVFMLIVAENYVVPAAWGAAPSEDLSVSPALFGEFAEITDKQEVMERLERSFTYALDAVSKISDQQMMETIQMFGRERTVQASLFMIVGDMHEHLGQAIAYARSNEVVPPWTARRQAGE